MKQELQIIARQTRQQLLDGTIDKSLLQKLYFAYNPLPHTEEFINTGLEMFPKLNCGIASVYLQYRLSKGEVVKGSFKEKNHTFLLVDGYVMDITADQFGGPAVYVGMPVASWKRRNYDN